jgi:hypothetical protein
VSTNSLEMPPMPKRYLIGSAPIVATKRKSSW